MAKEMYITLRCECYDCISCDCEKQEVRNITGLDSGDAMKKAVEKGWIVFEAYGITRYYAPGHTTRPRCVDRSLGLRIRTRR